MVRARSSNRGTVSYEVYLLLFLYSLCAWRRVFFRNPLSDTLHFCCLLMRVRVVELLSPRHVCATRHARLYRNCMYDTVSKFRVEQPVYIHTKKCRIFSVMHIVLFMKNAYCYFHGRCMLEDYAESDLADTLRSKYAGVVAS